VISVLCAEAEPLLLGVAERCRVAHRVTSLHEVRALLDRLAAQEAMHRPGTLDLIAHSTRGHHFLRIGDAIDMLDPVIDTFFRSVAADRLLPRLNIIALRLLGCETAVGPCGQRTMQLLARVLGVPVFGTSKVLLKSHFDADGFSPVFARCLLEASYLPTRPWLARRRFSLLLRKSTSAFSLGERFTRPG
jgi:hypothetical protein